MKSLIKFFSLVLVLGLCGCAPDDPKVDSTGIEVYQLYGEASGLIPVEMLLASSGPDLSILATRSPSDQSVPTLIGVNMDGSKRGVRNIAVPDSNFSYLPADLKDLESGGILFCGTAFFFNALTDISTVRPFIFNTEPSGDIRWSQVYAEDGFPELGNAIVAASNPDTVLVMVGSRRSGPTSDVMVQQVTSSGTLIRLDTFGTSATQEVGLDIANLGNDFLVLSSAEGPGGGNIGLEITRVDLSGNGTLLQRYENSSDILGQRIVVLDDGFLILGNTINELSLSGPWPPTYGSGPEVSYVLLAIDAAGNLLWENTGNPGLYARDVVQHADGTYSILCDTILNDGTSNIYVGELDSEGRFLSGQSYGYDSTETGAAMLAPSEDALLVVGETQNPGLRKTVYMQLQRDTSSD
ncbi:MAG: hypothetical protein AAGN35_18710 [Bacteroidota bacterium]